MTAQVFTPVTPGWPASPQYTAAANIDIALGNPHPTQTLAITTTTSGVPSIAVADAPIRIGPGDHKAMSLLSGERLFISVLGSKNGRASLEA